MKSAELHFASVSTHSGTSPACPLYPRPCFQCLLSFDVCSQHHSDYNVRDTYSLNYHFSLTLLHLYDLRAMGVFDLPLGMTDAFNVTDLHGKVNDCAGVRLSSVARYCSGSRPQLLCV